jgi:hypothetical protein
LFHFTNQNKIHLNLFELFSYKFNNFFSNRKKDGNNSLMLIIFFSLKINELKIEGKFSSFSMFIKSSFNLYFNRKYLKNNFN